MMKKKQWDEDEDEKKEGEIRDRQEKMFEKVSKVPLITLQLIYFMVKVWNGKSPRDFVFFSSSSSVS